MQRLSDCVPACPYGVITADKGGGGTAHKCTLCYDRLKGGLEPACAKACPTDSIQFGPIEELRARAQTRVDALQQRGCEGARLYGDPGGVGATHGVQSLRSFFLLLDEPNVYGLPAAPKLPSRNVGPGLLASFAAGALLVGATALALMGRKMREALERTGYRASLAAEYTDGHAPSLQNPVGEPLSKPSYFGLPAIKKPEWGWYVPACFFIGGTAAGAYISSSVADMVGRRADRPYIVAGRLVALFGVLASLPLLVADLGRPDRFLNMLRVFKPRSMMSTGSWALTAFGGFSGLAVGVEVLRVLSARWPLLRVLIVPLRVVSWFGVLPAMYVGSYTGVLLSATNVPLWAGNPFLMGPLFLSSAMSCGLAANRVGARFCGPVHPSGARRYARAEHRVLIAELVITIASALMLRGLAKPLLTGRWSRFYLVGSLGSGILAPLLLERLGLRGGFWTFVSSILVLVGGASTRLAVTEAGKESADDPHAYFAYTRP